MVISGRCLTALSSLSMLSDLPKAECGCKTITPRKLCPDPLLTCREIRRYCKQRQRSRSGNPSARGCAAAPAQAQLGAGRAQSTTAQELTRGPIRRRCTAPSVLAGWQRPVQAHLRRTLPQSLPQRLPLKGSWRRQCRVRLQSRQPQRMERKRRWRLQRQRGRMCPQRVGDT